MLGGLGAFLASEINGVVKRNLIVYGLYGLSALLIVCAAGYALNALHTMLVLRFGGVEASLMVAGGLIIAALLVFALAALIKSRRRPPRPLATTALAAAPIAAKLMGSRMSWRTALVGGIVVLGAVLGRQLFKGGDDGEDEA
ncbi:hypothetical protein [Bosea sp. (in: a-proteobacteria)]|jgi:hypothetical protein|uniref:hypothetical protein n=1 Tax=Bosea sp. (in: a-proteobacteria) TaxID=1871050 RepID=UPI003F6F1278